MYWNHRVMRCIEGAGTSYEDSVLYIREIFYNEEDNSIIGWTEKEFVYSSEKYDNGIEGLRQTLHWMLDALDKPILDEADLLAQAERIREMGGDAHEIGMQEIDGEVL